MGQYTTFLFGSLIFIFSVSCKPCEDCGQPAEGPYINVRFFNETHWLQVNDSLTSVEKRLDDVKELLNLIDDSQQDLKDSLEAESEMLAAQQDSLDGIVQTIDDGYIKIDTIYGWFPEFEQYSDSIMTFEDSASVYRFPLAMNSDLSEFRIVIEGNLYQLTLFHEREVFEELHKVKMRAYVDSAGYYFSLFKSVSIECMTSACISDEATVYITY